MKTPEPLRVEEVSDAQEAALAGIRTKLNRANSQLDRLHHEQGIFNDSEPYTTGKPRANADGSQYIHPLKFLRPIPLIWAVVLGEIIHDLRSALDHSVFQLTLAYTGHELGGTGFPIFDKSDRWDIRNKRSIAPDNPLGFSHGCAMYQVRGVGSGVVNYIKRLQPGWAQDPESSALLALQFLWNQDKHRLIHFWGVQLVADGSDIRVQGTNRPYTITLPTRILHDGDDAITLTFDGPVLNCSIVGRLHMKVAFDNPADRRPAVDRLWRLYDATAGVVSTLLASIGRQDEPIP